MKTLFRTLALSVALATSASATISFTGTYSENFDSVDSSGTTAPANWIIGNYTENAVVNRSMMVDDGSATVKGKVYNYGARGAADRALGSASTNTPGDTGVQVALTNNTGTALTELTISYTGEQWFQNNQNNSTLGYNVYISTANDDTAYTLLSALQFNHPHLAAGSGALDGNAAVNRTSISATIDLAALGYGPIADGANFFITWEDPNGVGNDHGIAVDDVTITTVGGHPSPVIKEQKFDAALFSTGAESGPLYFNRSVSHTSTGGVDLGFSHNGIASTSGGIGIAGVVNGAFQLSHYSSSSTRSELDLKNPRTGKLHFESVNLSGHANSSFSMNIADLGSPDKNDDIVVRLLINGNTTVTLLDTRPNKTGATGGVTLTHTFPPTDTSAQLLIDILSDDDDGYTFDNVSFTGTAAPNPSPGALLGLGGFTLILLHSNTLITPTTSK